MKLLTFAHRGEAQTFLKNLDLKSHSCVKDLYIGEELAILITKEGLENSFIRLSYAIAVLNDLKEIINFGICGAFNQSFKVGQIINIRTVFAKDEFKSFTLSGDPNNTTDLITSKERVLDLSSATKLSHIAPLVDRELWAQAMVAKEFNIKIQSIKIISDHISDAEVCEYIKDQALDFSDRLYDHFCSFSNKKENISNWNILKNNEFYFSVSQRRQLNNLLKLLINRNEKSEEQVISRDVLESAICQFDRPKDRSKFLITKLKESAYPHQKIIKDKLDNLLTPTSKKVIRFDQSLEKQVLNLNYQIEKEEDLLQIANSLKHFNWKEFKNIMQGDYDL